MGSARLEAHEVSPLVGRLQMQRLGEPRPEPEMRDIVTVEDIAEALDLPVETVAAELERMHTEDREARLVGVLRELEEPLYRVERPAVTPAETVNPLHRLRSVQTLIERARPVPLVRRAMTVDADERFGQQLGRWVLLIFAALFIALLVWGLWRGAS
ncbi:MAG: hypothetical protein SFX74_05350 [Fimbriimonadaceae bacterium]|nr:hypothetical protein [Fimbriimonadaceae bacterium]